MEEVKHYKLKQLPTKAIPNAIFYIKADGESEVKTYITDVNGVPYPLSEEGLVSISNTDGTITVTGVDNVEINLSTSIKNKINSALQAGDNISSLVNNAGYITLADVPSQVVNLGTTKTDDSVTVTNSNGSDAILTEATITEAGVLKASDKVKLNNTSGNNTGDETSTTIQTKRPIKNLVGRSLEGSGNFNLDTTDVTDTINKRYQTDAQKSNNDATSSIQTQLNSKENKSNKQNSMSIDGTGTKFPTVDAVIEYVQTNLGAEYSNIVYVNTVTPTTATIFDINNPPLNNNNSLKSDIANLYIGSDSSTWVYNTTISQYTTKPISSTSNFYLKDTLLDSGNNKNVDIERVGSVGGGNATLPNHFVTKSQSDLKVDKVAGERLINNSEIIKLGNQSGINTGDETTASIQAKRPLKTIEGEVLDGTGNILLTGKEPVFSKNTAFNKNFGTTNNTVVEGNDTRLVQAFQKKVNAISVTGDTNKTITITREDGTVITATFLDNDTQYPDDVINTLTFNANNNGVLIAITSLGEVLSVSLDGRYSLLGHIHNISDITGLQTALNNKQGVLTAGNNITIVGSVIDALGEGSTTTNVPTNYTPLTNTIKGNFQGIDNVLGLVYDKFTIAQIRAFSGVLKNNNIYTTDVGQEGNWYYDSTDSTSSDNTGTILVTSDGKRIKRVYINEASVKWFGAKGDGITDDTSNINLALSSVSSVFFPTGNYMVNAVTGLIVKSNQYIKLDAKAVLQCITNSATNYNIFKIEAVSNVIIQGGSIIGDRATHTGVTGEFGMGINILEAENITIKDMSISNCWGDGIYIGGHTLPSKKVTIDNVICDNNRRQGMSITYANAVLLKNSEFKNTNGKLPQYGIDIEPNAGEYALDIEIQNCKTYGNAGGGLQVYGVSGNQNGLKVDNLQSYNNALGLNLIKGTNITFTNSNIRNNTAYGVELTKDNRDITFDKCDFKENLYMGVALVASGQVLGTEKIYFTRCSFKNNSTADVNGRDGIRIENFDNTGYIKDIFFSQCFFGNTLVTPTQRYGISVEPADASISNIRVDARSIFTGNLTGAYNTVSGVLFIEQYFTNTEIALINSKTDGSGTTDYLPKFSGSKTFVNSGIREDANGNLGVNIFAPYNGGATQKYMSINGTSVAGHVFYVNSAIAFRFNSSATATSFVETRNLPINFLVNGAQRLSIEGNGNFRINDLSGTGDRNVVAAADGTLKIGIIDSRPYKVYTALLTQTGTSAPVATVLENTLGGTVVWTRTAPGYYQGTLSGAFTIGKTVGFSNIYSGGAGCAIFPKTINSVQLSTFATSTGATGDAIINPGNIEIRVYP